MSRSFTPWPGKDGNIHQAAFHAIREYLNYLQMQGIVTQGNYEVIGEVAHAQYATHVRVQMDIIEPEVSRIARRGDVSLRWDTSSFTQGQMGPLDLDHVQLDNEVFLNVWLRPYIELPFTEDVLIDLLNTWAEGEVL